MTRDKPLAAGSGRQPLPAPLEDCHLYHGRLGAQIVDDRREALVDFGGNARGRSTCTLLEHDGQQLFHELGIAPSSHRASASVARRRGTVVSRISAFAFLVRRVPMVAGVRGPSRLRFAPPSAAREPTIPSLAPRGSPVAPSTGEIDVNGVANRD